MDERINKLKAHARGATKDSGYVDDHYHHQQANFYTKKLMNISNSIASNAGLGAQCNAGG